MGAVFLCVQSVKNRLSQQRQFGPAVHHPFDEFEFVDASFDTPFERTVVQTLTVVDNSVFSSIRLTVPSDRPYVQEALSFSHFKPRGSV
jgi:hypothetical protein